MNSGVQPKGCASRSRDYFTRKQQDDLVAIEKSELGNGRLARRGAAASFPWTGLALSGGGIRSATFSLGVLQALARHNVLKDFDYISTVSGGGYIGASLQWWWSQTRSGTAPETFPYGPGSVLGDGPHASKEQRSKLDFLRDHGKYLIPGEGINIWSGLAVIIRTVLLSILVWLPLLTFCCFLVLLADFFVVDPVVSQAFHARVEHPAIPSPFAALAPTPKSPATASSIALEIPASTQAADAAKRRKDLAEAFALRSAHALLHWTVLFGAIVFAGTALIFALLSGTAEKPSQSWFRRWLPAALGVIPWLWIAMKIREQKISDFEPLDWSLVVSAALVGTMFIGRSLLQMFDHERQLSGSYFFRRALERQFGYWFLPWLTIVVLGAIPFLPLLAISKLDADAASPWHLIAGIVSILSGAASAVYGYFLKLNNWKPGLAGQIFAPLGAAIFLIGTLTIAYTLSLVALASSAGGAPTLDRLLDEHKTLVQVGFAVTCILTVLIGTFANLNHAGLHRFYRDRLMEVFMPSARAVKERRVSYSPTADRLNISDILTCGDAILSNKGLGYVPYPLVNAFAFLTDKDDGRVARRGGDNFLISPLFMGSRVTGWRKTSRYCEIYGPLSLATAMAVSGAAVNSNAGYIGTGITRDHLVSAVMTILNMRLGVWVGNPIHARRGLRKIPTYFFPMLTSGLLTDPREDDRFIELSDGGNFENLGIYELIRRKLSVIVVIDGEADLTLAFPALVSAVTRVKEDFGATIRFSSLQGPDQVLPTASLPGYPAGAQFSTSPFMIGEITYEDQKKGVLIYVKATLIKELDFTTYGYRASSSEFPHEGTEDQFFSEVQFEAYRNLGFVSASKMIDETKIVSWINSSAEPPVQVAGV